MRTGGMLCRSQAATAVCVPGDARSMVVGRRADRTIAEDARILHDVRLDQAVFANKFNFGQGGRDEGGYTLPGVCRESEEAHLQNGRGDIVQHRSGEQEGDGDGSRVPGGCPRERLKGQEG
ncbi:hypothetical protein ACQJBY_002852 [Aegilops geniculata]